MSTMNKLLLEIQELDKLLRELEDWVRAGQTSAGADSLSFLVCLRCFSPKKSVVDRPAVALRGAYVFDRIISTYIHIGSISLCWHKPLLLSSLNNSHILQLTGAGFNLTRMKTKVLLPPWK